MWAKHDCKTLVVAQVVSLLLLKLLRLGEGLTHGRAELLSLLMLITENGSSPHLNLSGIVARESHKRTGSESDLFLVLCFSWAGANCIVRRSSLGSHLRFLFCSLKFALLLRCHHFQWSKVEDIKFEAGLDARQILENELLAGGLVDRAVREVQILKLVSILSSL